MKHYNLDFLEGVMRSFRDRQSAGINVTPYTYHHPGTVLWNYVWVIPQNNDLTSYAVIVYEDRVLDDGFTHTFDRDKPVISWQV